MSYSFYDFLMLVGSLGLFLYGMKIMSEGLQKIAGEQLRNILSAMTKNRVMGVLTGVLITALIQSSSATTVMVVSFVNAGLLTLVQSIGVIMGANVGTTVTAWMISIFGFGKFSISVLSIPLLGIGLPLIFSAKSKRKSLGEFIFGFAFLFMGLDFLKNSMPDLQSHPEILSFVHNFSDMGFLSTLVFLLIGSILTIIVQSSSATVAITLIMCSKGWIGFEPAAAMILGENIGTTVTANIAALSANLSAKRAAFAHFMFNILGVIWILIFFKFFVHLTENIVSSFASENPLHMKAFMSTVSQEDLAAITSGAKLNAEQTVIQAKLLDFQAALSYGLAMFHSLFNIVNVCIMIWFVNFYEKLCKIVIRPKKGEEEDEEFQLQFITTGMLSTAELSILQAEKETEVYGKRTRRMYGFVKKLSTTEDEGKFVKLITRIDKYEGISDRMEVEIGLYLNRVAEGRLSNASKERIRRILRAVTEIESIADSCYNISKHFNRLQNDNQAKFPEQLTQNIFIMFSLLDRGFDKMQSVLSHGETLNIDLDIINDIENQMNETRNMLKRKNIEDVNEGKYSYQVGVYYMDIIVECERMGDYIINVIQAMKSKIEKE